MILVGEIATNHNGDYRLALELADQLINAGFHAVKGQYRTPREEWKQKDYSKVSYSYGKTYWDHREAVDLTINEHLALSRYCASKGVPYFVSIWDDDGVEVAKRIAKASQHSTVKIPSAKNNDYGLLDLVKKAELEAIMSLGMLDQEGLRRSVHILGESLFFLLVTTCAYPAEARDLNLERIWTLINEQGVYINGNWKVGFSGHHEGTIPDAVAVALGAQMIERHVTLDKTMRGPDHKMSMDPPEFRELVDVVRDAKLSIGTNDIKLYEAEIPFARKVGRIEEE